MKLRFHKFVVVLTLLPAWAAVQAQEPAADPYQALAKWEFGQSRQPLAQIEDQIRKTAPADHKAIEAKLLPVLKSPETPKDAKRYICRWLAVVGSADCVPAVAELLGDADLSHPDAWRWSRWPTRPRRPHSATRCPRSQASSCWALSRRSAHAATLRPSASCVA